MKLSMMVNVMGKLLNKLLGHQQAKQLLEIAIRILILIVVNGLMKAKYL